MLSADVLHELAEGVMEAETDLLRLIVNDEARQEDDITSRLAHGVRLFTRRVDNVQITMTVVDGVGPGAAESTIGADLIGAINVDVDGRSVQKGFLAQAKMAGDDGLYFRPVGTTPSGGADFSHAMSRGPASTALPVPGFFSGTIEVTRPRGRLPKQCRKMLGISPDSFVFVYDSAQVGVCSASSVLAHLNATQRIRHPLGTKTLADFFVNVADCFIGDLDLGAASQGLLVEQAQAHRARTALLLNVTTAPQ